MIRTFSFLGLVVVFFLLEGSAALSQVEVPVTANQFIESIGVNVHLGYTTRPITATSL